MNSQPVFVIGVPRSGTTFLCNALNQHPLIELTNESRVFVWLKDLVDTRSASPELIGSEIRQQFVDFVRESAGDWIEEFYRKGLGVTAPIWGDKHPPYADPSVLSRRGGSVERLPRSGSCLRLIRDCLSNAKFIHIHREPGSVARSLLGRGWVGSIDEGVEVWRQYVTEIVEFFDEIEEASRLSIVYEDLLFRPITTAATIGRFLRLPDWTSIEDFLLGQHRQPTPFSDPVTDLSTTYRRRKAGHSDSEALALAGEMAERLGYVPNSSGPARRSDVTTR